MWRQPFHSIVSLAVLHSASAIRLGFGLVPGPASNRPRYLGAVAQLGERLICTQEAVGSIPISSTMRAGL
jgi:hypothetical protein